MLDSRNHTAVDNTSREYSTDEVNRIIRRALSIKGSDAVSHQDLMETAGELGIDPFSLEEAIRTERSAAKGATARNARLKRKQEKFKNHLWSYIIVISGLVLINMMTPGPWWFQWTMLGWGIGLAFHYRSAYHFSG